MLSALYASGGGSSSPLTTKGDLFTFSTVAARLGVGSNGTLLCADSTQTTGLNWCSGISIPSLPASTGMASGDLLINYSAADSQAEKVTVAQLMTGLFGNAFFNVAGPATSIKTFTFPNASDTVVTLGAAQTITAVKTFTNSDLSLLGSSTGATTFTSANAGASNFVVTFPANTGTVGELNLAQSWTAAQTFSGGIGGYTVNVGAQAGTTCTLTSSGNAGCSGITNGVGDCGTFIRFSSSSAVTVTIPATLAVGCQIAIEQGGTAKVSVNGSAVTAATLHSAHSYTGTSAQYAVIGVTIDANSGGSSAIALLSGDGS